MNKNLVCRCVCLCGLLILTRLSNYLSLCNLYRQVFAGIQLGLFGFVIVMWGVFPRFLGYTVVVSGPCYILSSLLYLYWPNYDGNFTAFLMIPVIISQIGLAGWCLVSTPHPAKNREFLPGGMNAGPLQGILPSRSKDSQMA